MKERSGILGNHSRACPCTVWDWLVFEVQPGRPLVHYGGCSRALGSGTLGNAVGNSAR